MIDCCSILRITSGNKLKIYNDVKFEKFSDHIELYAKDVPIIKLYKHGHGIVVVKDDSMRLIPSSMVFSMDFKEVSPEFFDLFINNGYCVNRKCRGLLGLTNKSLYYIDKLHIDDDIKSILKKYI